MKIGAFTALITPFRPDGSINYDAFGRNIEFQIAQGIDGLVPCGTTGESPVLSPQEHMAIIRFVMEVVAGRTYVLAGTGSNNPQEAIEYCLNAIEAGVNGLLLVDCYYNKPNSAQLADNYYWLIAQAIHSIRPEIDLIPYIIPGRTGGTGLQSPELQQLAASCPNIRGVKDATGKLDNMAQIRELLGPEFVIFSGDDALTWAAMTDERIKAQGVISVISNILPDAVRDMVHLLLDGRLPLAREYQNLLADIFAQVTVTALDPKRNREFAYPNPCGIKYLMWLLSMDSGFLQPPLGSLPETAREPLIEILRALVKKTAFLKPAFEAYGRPDFLEAHTN